jgi:hypothetical protein
MENIELNFTFTFAEANAILAGLQELPAKIANPLIKKMQEQAQPQLPQSDGETTTPNLEIVK